MDDAGVCEDDIQSAEMARGQLYCRTSVVRHARVGGTGLRAATGCGSIVVEDHCRATAREFPRVGRTQAAGAAASRSPHGPRMMVAVNVGFAFLLT